MKGQRETVKINNQEGEGVTDLSTYYVYYIYMLCGGRVGAGLRDTFSVESIMLLIYYIICERRVH